MDDPSHDRIRAFARDLREAACGKQPDCAHPCFFGVKLVFGAPRIRFEHVPPPLFDGSQRGIDERPRDSSPPVIRVNEETSDAKYAVGRSKGQGAVWTLTEGLREHCSWRELHPPDGLPPLERDKTSYLVALGAKPG